MTNPHWWTLKDYVRRRARNRCEYCLLRPIADLHHRTYANNGAEHSMDVMGVCRACHRHIHDGRSVLVSENSIAAFGDHGTGTHSPHWLSYLKQVDCEESACNE